MVPQQFIQDSNKLTSKWCRSLTISVLGSHNVWHADTPDSLRKNRAFVDYPVDRIAAVSSVLGSSHQSNLLLVDLPISAVFLLILSIAVPFADFPFRCLISVNNQIPLDSFAGRKKKWMVLFVGIRIAWITLKYMNVLKVYQWMWYFIFKSLFHVWIDQILV